MKLTIDKLNGIVKRDTDTYVVEDNNYLENLTVSKTVLHPGKSTTGHAHSGIDEVYYFISGTGQMQLGDIKFPVNSGDVVLIQEGKFHRVFNDISDIKQDLVFICVFQAYER